MKIQNLISPIGAALLLGAFATHVSAQAMEEAHGGHVRLHFRGTPGIALQRQSGATLSEQTRIFGARVGNPGAVSEYELVCIAPCVAHGTSGNFQFALAREGENTVAVERRTSFAPGNYVLTGDVESRETARTVGWILLAAAPSLGAAIGIPMMQYTERPSALFMPTGAASTTPLFNAGVALMTFIGVAGIVAGVVLILLRDVAHLEVEPDLSVSF